MDREQTFKACRPEVADAVSIGGFLVPRVLIESTDIFAAPTIRPTYVSRMAAEWGDGFAKMAEAYNGLGYRDAVMRAGMLITGPRLPEDSVISAVAGGD